jgi:hypothetical protein
MVDMKIEVRGGTEAATSLRLAGKGLDAKVSKSVRHHGQLLRTRVMAKASGRPGPNIVTGDYRRSWQLQVAGAGKGTTATVGTNAPQGRRLEHGFHGMDSLGRVYSQPPFPHAGPAFDEIVPLFVADFERIAKQVTRSR